jgi:hypothetical protein
MPAKLIPGLWKGKKEEGVCRHYRLPACAF